MTPMRTMHSTNSVGERTVADDEPALRSPDAAGRSDETQDDRLHGGRVVHLHAAEAVATRARPRPRSPEPDRPVAALAPRWCRADADGRLGAVDRDIAGGS